MHDTYGVILRPLAGTCQVRYHGLWPLYLILCYHKQTQNFWVINHQTNEADYFSLVLMMFFVPNCHIWGKWPNWSHLAPPFFVSFMFSRYLLVQSTPEKSLVHDTYGVNWSNFTWSIGAFYPGMTHYFLSVLLFFAFCLLVFSCDRKLTMILLGEFEGQFGVPFLARAGLMPPAGIS